MTVWQGIRTVLSAVEDKNWPEEFCVFLVGDGVERNYVEEVAARVPKCRLFVLKTWRDVGPMDWHH